MTTAFPVSISMVTIILCYAVFVTAFRFGSTAHNSHYVIFVKRGTLDSRDMLIWKRTKAHHEDRFLAICLHGDIVLLSFDKTGLFSDWFENKMHFFLYKT